MNIAQLDRWAGSVLEVLWRSSWQAAVLALLVLAMQWALRSRLSARWRHNLWLLVLLRLVVPVTPSSQWSVFNLLPSSHAPVAIVTSTDIPLAPPLASLHAAIPMDVAKPQATTAPAARWRLILASIWICGVALLLARILVATARLIASTRRMRTIDDDAVTTLVDHCRQELGGTREVRLLASDDLTAPALMGVLHPKLLLPRNVIDNFDPAELRLILLHELAHLKRNDVAINWLVAMLQALHWFNPLLWLAFARLRSDRELACDEMVLAAAGADHHQYGHTIVKLLESLPTRLPAHHPAQAAAVGILERAHPMRRRITMIAQFPRRAKQWTILAALCMLALAAAGLTDAVRGEDAAPKTPPNAGKASSSIAPTTTAVGDPEAIPALGIVPTTRSAGPLSDEEITYRFLQRRLPEARFDAIGLSDVIGFLSDVTGQNIVVNWRALESAGVDRNAPVSLQLKDVTLEQILRHLGTVAGGDTVQMGFGIDGKSIVFSTYEDVVRYTRVRLYDVSDLVTSATTRPGAEGTIAAMETIMRAVTDNVTPDAWRESGGSVGSISIFGNKLLIKATDMMHLDVDKLLAELRR